VTDSIDRSAELRMMKIAVSRDPVDPVRIRSCRRLNLAPTLLL
jgi:hypothetical protein